ncbi:MAG TPA: precorrin-8X methylmutase [Streptosporangiaceae bacterium]|nr:precorrin-8X methylmutase [Streptosporangiaceae bacterium]
MVSWPERPDARGQVEDEAYRILRSRLDLTRLPRLSRDVTERIICASADLSYVGDLVCAEDSLAAAVVALAAGAPVIADGPMVAAGIAGWPVICKADEPLTTRLARTAGIGAAAAAVRLAFGEAGSGAVWVVGCEPSAIYEIIGRGVQPAFVIGVPAGLAGAAEAKKALRGSGLPALTNISCKGGPVTAVAACLALLRRASSVPAKRPRRGGGDPATAVLQEDMTL